jgi:surface antigen
MSRQPLSKMLAGAVLATAIIVFAGPGMAEHKSGHNPPGHNKNDKGHYVKEKNGGSPPRWAPAWGYRGKEKVRYVKGGTTYVVDPPDLIPFRDSGFGTCNRDIIGALIGGAAGAAAGSRFGKGDGKILTTVGGAIIGALIGGNIGRGMDQVDQNCVGQTLERAPDGTTVAWRDPDLGGQYQVTPTKTWQDGNAYCREYQTRIVIGGKLEEAWGTACRQADGSWKRT